MLFFTAISHGQVSLSYNLVMPPPWGPAGYTDVRYYYLPDVEAYFDIHFSKFIYFEDEKWIYRSYLPKQYSSYDLYGGYKVVMTEYYGNTPFIYFKEYKIKYAKGYRGLEQKTIGIDTVAENSRIELLFQVFSAKMDSLNYISIEEKSHAKNKGKNRTPKSRKDKK